MKQKQLDIFSRDPEAPNADGEAQGAEPVRPKRRRPPQKRRRASKPREAKKAPMLVDAYAPGAAPLPVESGRPSSVAEVQGPRIYTVSELTDLLKGVVDRAFPDIWVTGEVTDFRGRNGPHLYFALKDEQGNKLRVVVFGAERAVPFEIKDGLELIGHGRLNIYGRGSQYSLVADFLEPRGIGALQLAFEQLKKKLEAEGLFRSAHKKPLPVLPRRIGVVTSPTGAAIRDIVHVLTRRFPNIEVLLHPVRVQGEGAAAEIAEAISTMNRIGGLDLLIVGRGGGSIEDLWAFNEEVVARAIFASRIPIISAVGHEIDFTIADFVADLRAATPSAAAEIAVPVRADLVSAVNDDRRKLVLALKQLIVNRGHELARLSGRLVDPRRRLPDFMLRVDGLRQRLLFVLKTGMERRAAHLAKLMSNLDHLSPLGVLAKGYSVVTGPDGRAVVSSKSIKRGDELGIRFHQGGARAKVSRTIDE